MQIRLTSCIAGCHGHWNGNVFILVKFSSLAALKVVKLTTSSAASDENFIKNDDIFVSVVGHGLTPQHSCVELMQQQAAVQQPDLLMWSHDQPLQPSRHHGQFLE